MRSRTRWRRGSQRGPDRSPWFGVLLVVAGTAVLAVAALVLPGVLRAGHAAPGRPAHPADHRPPGLAGAGSAVPVQVGSASTHPPASAPHRHPARSASGSAPPATPSPSRPPSPSPSGSPSAGRSLVPSHGALFGAYAAPTSGDDYRAMEGAITTLDRQIGRALAIDNLFVRWDHQLPVRVARWDLSQGIIPMISWAGAPAHLISSGAYDGMIRADAFQLRALRKPVMVRWFAEMDGIAKHSLAESPGHFIAAWRHVHDIFARAGAKNVTWVWCPNAFHFADGVSQAYYPGASYVGWICADGYNWAPGRPNASWVSIGHIFSAFYHWGLRSGKPMMIGEYGVMERAPGQKAAWFRQADAQLRTQLTAIKAVVYFNSVHSGMNWRVTSSVAALAAFRAFARDPYFASRIPIG